MGLCWIESRGVSACADAPLFRFWRGWILGLSRATRRAVQAIRFFAGNARHYFANGFKSCYGRIDCVRQAARTEAVQPRPFLSGGLSSNWLEKLDRNVEFERRFRNRPNLFFVCGDWNAHDALVAHFGKGAFLLWRTVSAALFFWCLWFADAH